MRGVELAESNLGYTRDLQSAVKLHLQLLHCIYNLHRAYMATKQSLAVTGFDTCVGRL